MVWHVGVTGRDASDIMSAYHQLLIANRDATSIVIWADNCACQNKNWDLVLYLLKMVHSNIISAEQIELKFLQTGHTFMSADSFHHNVE